MGIEQSTHQVARRFLFIATNSIPLFDPESQGEKAPVLGELTAPLVPAIIALGLCASGANRGIMTRRNPLKDRKYRDDMFTQGMVWCSKCRQFFPIKDFGPTATDRGNYGYRGHCLRCEKTHKIKTTDQRSDYFKKRNNALKAQFVELAGGKCQRCGYDGFYAALDFHHVYPALKKFIPMKVVYSGDFEKAWREIDKCCLLCRNCHAAYEATMWRAEFFKRNGLGYTVGSELPLDDNRYETDKPPKYQQAPLPLFTQRPASAQQLGFTL